MSEPFVSIIMASHNPADPQMLCDAIDSIIRQTWTNWELILCDDGSSHPHADYLRQAAKRDNRIRYFRCSENGGLAQAMNLCLSRARGTLIARMDDDDLSEPERLEKQVRFLQSNPAYAWVGCQAWLFDEGGIWGIGSRPEVPQPRDFLKYSPYIHPSVMFRREVLDQSGGYQVSPLTLRCEDYELFMRLTAKGLQGYNLSEPLFCYRESASALMKRTFTSCFREMLIRFYGFRALRLLSLRTVPYLCKPLAVGLLACMPKLTQKIRIKRTTDNHLLCCDDHQEEKLYAKSEVL